MKTLTTRQKKCLAACVVTGDISTARNELKLEPHTFYRNLSNISDKLGTCDPSQPGWAAHSAIVAIATGQLDSMDLAVQVSAYNVPDEL